jgi:hypothetical protein
MWLANIRLACWFQVALLQAWMFVVRGGDNARETNRPPVCATPPQTTEQKNQRVNASVAVCRHRGLCFAVAQYRLIGIKLVSLSNVYLVSMRQGNFQPAPFVSCEMCACACLCARRVSDV